jgi:pyruvate,orthophosphate dikinase
MEPDQEDPWWRRPPLVSFVFDLGHRHDLPSDQLVALVGGKAASLAMMAGELGLPVPPGFVITTDACRAFLSGGWPAGLDDEIRGAIGGLESTAGRRFGDPRNPLLLSIRSGAPVSMPGMMDTILNVGLNDETQRGLAAASGDAAFAQDCRRRLAEMFTKTVGVDTVPSDPWRQLREGAEAVFCSWNSDRAVAYRSREGIPENLGTAVTVQAMVFGNLGADSASGVLFTRNPATGEPGVYGDVLFASQGEDVVAGGHHTEPLSALDARLPAVASELRLHSASLERHFYDLCDIEFTIERGQLWLLQVRVGKRSPRAALRIAVDMAEAADFPLSRADAVKRVAKLLEHPPMISDGRARDAVAISAGLGASPGMATGEIATSPEAAVAAAASGRPVILVRSETSPDDVRGMARAAGVLTSRGGLASHAAVVARGWEIPAVVGAEGVTVGDRWIEVGGRVLKAGELITIDGGTGEIFAGAVAGTSAVAPEAATMLGWATELGIEIGAAGDDQASRGEGSEGVSSDDAIRALLIKGSASPDALPAAKLIDSGLIELHDGSYRLTKQGRTKGRALLAEDRARWGDARARAALDDFHVLDQRMKEAVTSWQLRDEGGAQALNDHSDAAYDARVLDRIAELHDDVARWLTALYQAPRQLDRYRERLARALASARAGDHRFVASPRVDSYHGVWFELHEELILLAGRTRADEAAAGRA